MKTLRVLVVEDSLTIRKRMVDILSRSEGITVVGEAADGRAALELCQKLRPDVLTLDMALPVMSGLAVTEYVMAYCPTPILIVSASVNRGALVRTFDALQAGAVDVLEKESAATPSEEWAERLVSAVRMVARIKVITHPRKRLGLSPAGAEGVTEVGSPPSTVGLDGRVPGAMGEMRLLAIGASTGGPGALRDILGRLPRDFPLPIVVVLHLDRLFAQGFIDWLGGESALPVSEAQHGERLPPRGEARVLVAPPGAHLVVRGGRFELDHGPERHSCRPSVDVLFESLAESLGPRTVACLLTGMGRDGASGLLAIREAGGLTFAQDEASSAVFGMPKEAIALGAARQVLALGDFAPTLMDLFPSPRGAR